MSIQSRLNALDRVAAEAGWNDGFCKTCGVPSSVLRGVILWDGKQAEECSECGRTLDEDGRPLGKHGKIVRIHFGPAVELD